MVHSADETARGFRVIEVNVSTLPFSYITVLNITYRYFV